MNHRNKNNAGLLKCVRELFFAFNLNNIIGARHLTNSTIEDLNGKYVIRTKFSNDTGLFDNGGKQRDAYVDNYFENFKQNLIHRFYNKESGAMKSFDFTAFPFFINRNKEYKRSLDKGYESGSSCYYVDIPVSESDLLGLICNLKSCVAHALAKSIERHLEGEITSYAMRKDGYIMCSEFATHNIAKEFAEKYCWLIRKYDGKLKDDNIVQVQNKQVYVKDVFDEKFIQSFIKSKTRFVASRLLNDDDDYGELGTLRNSLDQVIYSAIGLKVVRYVSAPYRINQPELGDYKNIIWVPVVEDERGKNRYLSCEEVEQINKSLCGESSEAKVLNDVGDLVDIQALNLSHTAVEDSGLYGIDFYNYDIAHCVMSTIIKEAAIKYDTKSKKCTLSVVTDLSQHKFEHEVPIIEPLLDHLSPTGFAKLTALSMAIGSDSGCGPSNQTSLNTTQEILLSSSSSSISASSNKFGRGESSESNESNMAIPSSYMSSGGSRIKETKSPDSEGSPSSKVSESRTSSGGSQKKNEPFQHR